MADAVLFDLDGTLIPLDAIFAATEETRRRFSLPKISRETIKKEIVGRPFSAKASFLLSGKELSGDEKGKALEFYKSAFEKHYSRQKTFGFVRAVFSILQRKGIKTAVVTTTESRLAQIVLKRNGISPGFIVGSDHTKESKPSAQPIHLALSKLEKKPANAIMVGDSIYDIAAAKSAGCLSAGVLTGLHNRRELQKAGADYVLANVSEVVEII